MIEKKEDLNQYKEAYEKQFKFNDENLAMLKWYSARLVDKASALNKLDILSLGIGHRTVSKAIIEQLADRIHQYIILEGSQTIIDRYLSEHTPPDCVELVQGFFEEYQNSNFFDLIEMGFVLEHVDDPQYIVERYRKMLKKDGTIFIAVPNARCLHRVVGYEAGLLKNLYQLSEHDIQLGHKRYFDLESITKLVENAGFKIISTEGIFLKPITTDQMNSLHLPDEIMQAFFEVGRKYPEMCNAILIEAKK